MKKHNYSFLLVLFLSFFLSFSLTAQTQKKAVNWFTDEMPALSAQWAFSVPFAKDLRMHSPAEDFKLAADFRELRIDSGFKYQCKQFDLTSRLFYMPTFFNSFQAGVGLNYHFYRYEKTFTENDIIISGRFRWIKGAVFTCEIAQGLFFKFAVIDALKNHKPAIFNLSYQFELLCKWQLFQPLAVWSSLNLQDYFDYPLAISPIIKFGTDISFSPGIILGIDYSLKFIDMFYSAVYLNESVLRFSFKVVL